MPVPDGKDEKAQPDRILRHDFQYDPDIDRYTCPNGQALSYKYTINDDGRLYRAYQSVPKECADCALKAKCLPSKGRYRTVTRGAYKTVYAAHRERMETKGVEMMRQRSALCEHPFGTLKRWCGWTHFLLRGLEKVRAEWSLMMLGYNFKRVLSICGVAAFRAYCTTRAHQPMAVSC